MKQPLVKYPYRGGINWMLFALMDVPDYANPEYVYLRRFIIFKTPWFGLYLHIIYVPDGDRDVHNHPMEFWSWAVWGGYHELVMHTEVLGPEYSTYENQFYEHKRHGWLSFHHHPMGVFHSIKSLLKTPTITLVFTGKRAKTWGFMTSDGLVDYKDYNHAKETA